MHSKKTLASTCKELVDRIKSLCYLVEDLDLIKEVNSTLHSLVEQMEMSAPRDYGLILEAKKKPPNPKCAFKFPNLPAKKKKNPVSGRVGSASEKRKHEIQVTEKTASKKEENLDCIEEFVTMYGKSFDIPTVDDLNHSVESSSPVERPVESNPPCEHPVKSNPPVERQVESNPPVKRPVKSNPLKPKLKFLKGKSRIKRPAEELIVTKVVQPSGKPKKARKILLSEHEVNLIKSNKMLTDESINLAQNYLHEAFPQFEGFFDTSLMKLNTSEIIKSSSSYIQILNIGNLHWICVSSVDPSKINNRFHSVYDSLAGSHVSSEAQSVIAGYSFCKEPSLQLTVASVQQQNNGVDCGVFAIAFATALAHGMDPSKIAFDVSLMRGHLLKCLIAKKMSLFPTTSKRVRVCKSEKTLVPIYCHCRLPHCEDDKMVRCVSCREWFHFKCEKIRPSKNLTNANWKCSLCQKSIVH